MMTLIFVAGAVIGWATHQAWSDAMHGVAKATWAAEQKELFEEIRRLRTQVSALVGK